MKGYECLDTGGIVFKRGPNAGKSRDVACGQCLGCRADKRRHWAARMTHEAAMHKDNCFITLTYRDKWNATAEQQQKGHYIPRDGSLNKKHFQKFLKRLRKKFTNRRIRYYQCGEYGDQRDRPHYHACLFNFDFSDKQLLKQEEGYFLFTSKTLEKLWPYGFSTVAEMTYETAAYTAGYVTKKITGHEAESHYEKLDEETGELYQLQPEYSTMSRGATCKKHKGIPYQVDCPNCSRGLGRDWYEKYKTDVFPSDETPIPGKGVYNGVPRYYETILEAQDEQAYNNLKDIRQTFLKNHIKEYTPARLMDKYKVHKKRESLTEEKRRLRKCT